MKGKIKVEFGIKFKVKDFEMAEEHDGIEIEVEYSDEADLERQIEKWQDIIQKKVVSGAFAGANKYLEAKKEITE